MNKVEHYENLLSLKKRNLEWTKELVSKNQIRIDRSNEEIKRLNDECKIANEVLCDLEYAFVGTGIIDDFDKSGFVVSLKDKCKDDIHNFKEEIENRKHEIKVWNEKNSNHLKVIKECKAAIPIIEHVISEAKK